MSESSSDTLVLFGATGDLAFKKIFPALYALTRRGRLDMPVIGVAKREWTVEQFRARARDSVKAHGEFDEQIFARFAERLQYVAGEYEHPATFEALRRLLSSSEHPLFYLAIPPSLFGKVVSELAKSGVAERARLIVEKPFGRDLKSAQALNATIHQSFPEPCVFRIDHFLGKEAVQNLFYFRFANTILEPVLNCDFVDAVEITMAESFGVEGRGRFYEEVGAIRDVFQNHLLQILCLLAMEPPSGNSAEAIDAARVNVLRAIRPLRAADVVRGQFRGYRNEQGVARDSRVETYAAIRVTIDNERWAGVPFVVRTGKCLAQTATDVRVQFKRSPFPLFDSNAAAHPNELAFGLSPDVYISLKARAKRPGEEMIGEDVRLVDRRCLGDEMEPYERLIGDALIGDRTLFGSQAGVEAAWRVVDGVIRHTDPVIEYECGSWGPDASELVRQ